LAVALRDMTKDLIKKLIFIWTIITLIVDVSTAIKVASGTDYYWLVPLFVGVDVFICWTCYKMLTGRRWGLITLLIYFGLRTITVYTESFSFYIKSGLNLEILIAKTIGVNLTALLVLILLLIELNKTPDVKLDNE
jgi:hypothetical protein